MPKGCLRSLGYLPGLPLGNHILEPKLNGTFPLLSSSVVLFSVYEVCLTTNDCLRNTIEILSGQMIHVP